MGNRFKCKIKTIKLWGENIQDLGFGEKFLDMTSKAQSIKEKANKLYFLKIKNFFSVNDPVRTMKK